MALEIERKFLVKSENYKTESFKKLKIIQGFLSSVPERTVRVRIIGESGFITVKGIGNASGVSRYEWENQIPVKEAQELLKICEPGVIDKIRYFVKSGIHTYEVDEFYGENRGLVVAEIELSSEEETFNKPEWLCREVTGITKYYNSALANNPYSKW